MLEKRTTAEKVREVGSACGVFHGVMFSDVRVGVEEKSRTKRVYARLELRLCVAFLLRLIMNVFNRSRDSRVAVFISLPWCNGDIISMIIMIIVMIIATGDIRGVERRIE